MEDKQHFTLNDDKLPRSEGRVYELLTTCAIGLYDPENENTSMNPYSAIWDTGATHSVISGQVVSDLGLIPTEMVKVYTASTGDEPIDAYAYRINVQLPNGKTISDVKVLACQLSGSDMLIGMDIITQCDFAITNKDGKTTFSFQTPSLYRIDFGKEQPFS
jgi:predicted aspartyl protease